MQLIVSVQIYGQDTRSSVIIIPPLIVIEAGGGRYTMHWSDGRDGWPSCFCQSVLPKTKLNKAVLFSQDVFSLYTNGVLCSK